MHICNLRENSETYNKATKGNNIKSKFTVTRKGLIFTGIPGRQDNRISK